MSRSRASYNQGNTNQSTGQGYTWTPGIHSPEQVSGWRKVTKAVHKKEGLIFAQFWHVGRLSHTTFQPGQKAPVSSSALVADGVEVYIMPDGRGPDVNDLKWYEG